MTPYCSGTGYVTVFTALKFMANDGRTFRMPAARDRQHNRRDAISNVVIADSGQAVSGKDLARRSPAPRVAAWQIPPLHLLKREESRLAIRGESPNPICKEIALKSNPANSIT
jgi:hypothetical protein